MTNVVRLAANSARRTLHSIFGGSIGANVKHDHYFDFGYPELLQFDDFLKMYERNGMASAAVSKTVQKTWESVPSLLEQERDGSQVGAAKETDLEKQVRTRFYDLRLWAHLSEVDARSLVGAYAGLILRFADSKRFNEPVDKVPGGLLGLVEVIPAWQGQLTVSEWDTDQESEAYGSPKMYQFDESSVGDKTQPRQLQIHPDRIIIWSKDGTLNGTSALQPGYNDLLTLEKVSGAGGEGFWKNAKSAPVFEMNPDAKLEQLMRGLGAKTAEEVFDKMTDQVADWQKGFDQLLVLQGMQAKTLPITMPSPEHFFAIALQSYAASWSIPLKILVGSQTGERASTEDAAEWSRTIMSRRAMQTVPNIKVLIDRLERVGVLPEKDWYVDQDDLTEASMDQKMERASKMTEIDSKLAPSGEWVFTPEEIRTAVGFEPLSESEKTRDDVVDDVEDPAMPTKPGKTEPTK